VPDYRRNYVAGGTYFFTCVTHCRAPILTSALGRRCLRQAIVRVRRDYPFQIVATVPLPDHWHSVWTLPAGDSRYPMRWMRIKEEFTEAWLARGGSELPQSESRKRRRQRGVWHNRYWEHTVRDDDDLKRCVDYIHWNPCKHGLLLLRARLFPLPKQGGRAHEDQGQPDRPQTEDHSARAEGQAAPTHDPDGNRMG